MNPHVEDGKCTCFFCKNKDVADRLKDIVELANKESPEDRMLIAKSLVMAVVARTEMCLIDRLGVLALCSHDILEFSKTQQSESVDEEEIPFYVS